MWVHCLTEMGLNVTVTKTGSGVIVVSAKTERKNGISVQNTNQLAGNHTFIILLTLISFQGKCPHSPFRWLVVSLVPFLGFQTIPSLCPTQTNWIVLHAMMVKHPNCLSKQMTAVMLQLAPGHRDHGGKCETFSHDKCLSVTAVLKDCLSTGLTRCRMHKVSRNETRTRGRKTAGGDRGKCKYMILL